MAIHNKTRSMVIAPLAVMLLLTVIMGFSAYQLTQGWDNAINGLSSQVTDAVILNNIRWELAQAAQANTPKEALHSWHQAQGELMVMPVGRRPQVLVDLLRDDRNLSHVSAYLTLDVFHLNLEEVLTGLNAAQRYAQDANLMTTVSMVVLGLVLLFITVRDLNKLVMQLQASRDLNVVVQEEERRRLAQELHDGVVQEMIGLKRDYTPDKVDALVDTIRRVCHNLKPQVLDDLGLAAAIDFLAEDLHAHGITNVTVSMDREQLAQLPKRYELPIFRVVQEIFSNIRQHAKASQVTLNLVYHPEEGPMLRAYVSDNGVGFDPKKPPRKGLGLTGIQERIQQLDGRITIESSPGQGSEFRLMIPIHPGA